MVLIEWAIPKKIIAKHGKEGLYNAQSFIFNDNFNNDILQQAIEVGRSFIQRKYWQSNALDYLWNGIGIYLKKFSGIRYLFGGVSISDAFSIKAQSLVIAYYQKWYSGSQKYCQAKDEFIIPEALKTEIENILNSDTPKEDFKILKKALKKMEFKIPVLYRRYSEMTEYGGASFYAYSINKTFSNAIDSLIVIDLEKIRPALAQRYFGNTGYVKPENDADIYARA